MFDSQEPGGRYKKIVVFIILYLVNIGIAACRATLSYIAGAIAASGRVEGFNATFLGYVNFSFLMSLGSTYMLFGWVGDRMDSKKFIMIGAVTVGVLFLGMGLMVEFSSLNKWFYLIMLSSIGVFASTPWPGSLSIFNSWFQSKDQGLHLGYLSTCVNAGNIIGFLMAGVTVEYMNLPILTPMFLASTLLLGSAFIAQGTLETKPVTSKIEEKEFTGEELTIWKAWLIPGVAIYALALGCIRSISQILGTWLPNYLENLHISHVAMINASVDVGAAIGGVAVCYLGCRFNKRATFIVPLLILGTLLMVSINYLKRLENPVLLYMILSFFSGFCIGGCYNNIHSAVSVQLANSKAMNKYKRGISTITSLLKGYSTIYGAMIQLVIPYVYKWIFIFCGIQSIIAGILFLPIIFTEWRKQAPEKELLKVHESNEIELKES